MRLERKEVIIQILSKKDNKLRESREAMESVLSEQKKQHTGKFQKVCRVSGKNYHK